MRLILCTVVLAGAGLAAQSPKVPPGDEIAVLAGGCFWGVEAVFERLKGVKDVVSGFAGGSKSSAHYDIVSTGTTGHAEAVRITYDPSQISYEQLLKVFFVVAHDPTQLNRQGPDEGTEYRSSIFFADTRQQAIAEAFIKHLNDMKLFRRAVVTTVVPLEGFYPAESYHQDFVRKNPRYPYVVYNDLPKLEHLGKAFPELLAHSADSVEIVRLPHGAMQPDLAVDSTGTIHMVYLAGEPGAADVFYVHSSDGGKTFSRPVQVNSGTGSAIATGTIRGAQIALGNKGRVGRVHVAWNGSDRAVPKPPAIPGSNREGMPMLYARLNPQTKTFEPQRNLMTRSTNLDGGGSIAADDRGDVYVAWHGNGGEGGGEESRRVWIARSVDEGQTFAKEVAVSDMSPGVCGCCGLRLLATKAGDLHLLYRSATNKTHRDVYSLVSRDRGQTFTGKRVQGWEIGACPMTSMAIAAGKDVLGAWETDGQVHFAPLDGGNRSSAPPVTDTSETARRKHPRLAISASGTVLLAWTEGTSWARGGSLAWQAFTPDGKVTSVKGSRPGVPVWSFPAVAALPDGRFTIFY